MSYASDVTCQPLAIVNATRFVTRIATTNRWGKVLIFKPKVFSFYATEFSHMDFLQWKIDQILGFWADQGLKFSRKTCFCGFKSSLAVNSYVAKPESWPFQKCELKLFVFQKALIWQRLLANQLGRFEYNFSCLKWFFSKLPRKLRSALAFGQVTEVPKLTCSNYKLQGNFIEAV